MEVLVCVGLGLFSPISRHHCLYTGSPPTYWSHLGGENHRSGKRVDQIILTNVDRNNMKFYNRYHLCRCRYFFQSLFAFRVMLLGKPSRFGFHLCKTLLVTEALTCKYCVCQPAQTSPLLRIPAIDGPRPRPLNDYLHL